ncbi:MAG: hypothetical protein K2G70_06110 [Turicibacter sp.]|nr:hypothetical protein [Turicibacter sp.]
MTSEEKEARFEEIATCLKKRDLLKIREILLDNLKKYADDKDFLADCYHLSLRDSLIFQEHNLEMLDYVLEHWSEDNYPQLLADLKKNFSRRRYHLAMNLATYFYEQKQPQEEAEENDELELELKPVKKKRAKKPKRILPLEEKYTVTGIGTTSLLLLVMVVQLLLNGE